MNKYITSSPKLGSPNRKRQGGSIVELALVLPLLMLTVIGLCAAQVGVFRYNQIAALAQESARWASVHGKEYARQNKTTVADASTISENVLKPRAVGLDLNKLDLKVNWNEERTLVTVQIAYQWAPVAYFQSQTISCTAVAFSAY